MLATRPTVHGKRYHRPAPVTPATVTPDQHDAILLAFAQDVLKYEQAQLNIHFAWIGLSHPCPCNDCRGIVHEFDGFAAQARQIVRDHMAKQGEQAAQEMLNAGHAQQERTVKCPVCGKWARREGERYYHLEVKSLATGERVGDKQLFCQAERISPIPDTAQINVQADADLVVANMQEVAA